MESKIFTLDGLLEQEEIILFDSSVINLQAFSREYFGESLGFNVDLLPEDCALTQAVINFIEKGRGKVYTTGNVADELVKTKEMVENGLRAVNYLKEQARRKHAKYRAVSKTTDEALNSLLFNINKLMRISRRKEVMYTPSNSACYSDIFNLARMFGGYFKNWHIKRKGKKQEHDERTDEGILATAYYIALFEGKSPAILTEDSGFFNMLVMGHSLMTAHDLGYSNEIRKMFKPIRLFFREYQDKYTFRISTSDVDSHKTFGINFLTPEKNESAKKYVGVLLGRILKKARIV